MEGTPVGVWMWSSSWNKEQYQRSQTRPHNLLHAGDKDELQCSSTAQLQGRVSVRLQGCLGTRSIYTLETQYAPIDAGIRLVGESLEKKTGRTT